MLKEYIKKMKDRIYKYIKLWIDLCKEYKLIPIAIIIEIILIVIAYLYLK